jgi:hypothetical protein
MQNAHPVYDHTATWDTNEIHRWIGNVEELYLVAVHIAENVTFDSVAESKLYDLCANYGIPGVNLDAVNWADVLEGI